REVVGHDSRRPPEKGERGLRHTSHPHRHQFPNPYSVLARKDRQWIPVEVQRGTERRTFHVRAQGPSLFAQFPNGYHSILCSIFVGKNNWPMVEASVHATF